VPLLGLIKKEERSVVLLYRLKLWKVLKVTKVNVLSLRTGQCCLAQGVCERTEKFKKGQAHVTDAEYMGYCFDVNGQHETELQKPKNLKIEGNCYRNCAGFKSSARVSLCGTAFLNGGC
jgi:hypothetical protein